MLSYIWDSRKGETTLKKLAVLGCTGSIGTQTLIVVDEWKEEYQVILLVGHRNWQLLLQQAEKYKPLCVVLTEEMAYYRFCQENSDDSITIKQGMQGVLEALESYEIDMVIGAISGAAGIAPTLKALELGIDIGLANKETLVSGGALVRKAQEKSGAKILPVDSEHSAIFQCLEPGDCVARILLTASGGPFRNADMKALRQVTPEQALKHPNWSMGKKITVDSATLMNKGLEVIEANWLFQTDYDKIKVLVHPQSVVHSMVEYQDGSILAHLGPTDMKIPIQYAMTYPERKANHFQKLDFKKLAGLEFLEPDFVRFPALHIAYAAGRTGKSAPAVLNAANEVAVGAFLEKRLSFLGIPHLVEAVLEQHQPEEIVAFSQLMQVDQWARQQAEQFLKCDKLS